MAFYSDVFGMSEGVPRYDGPQSVKMAFLRVADGTNHHDLGLLEVGPDAPSAPDGAVGLFHFAGQTAARVRNVVYRGNWPRTFRPLAKP